jgi:hypothetical protein
MAVRKGSSALEDIHAPFGFGTAGSAAEEMKQDGMMKRSKSIAQIHDAVGRLLQDGGETDAARLTTSAQWIKYKSYALRL